MDPSAILAAALTSKQNELDSIMGSNNRIPRLSSAAGFQEWKYRFEKHIRTREPKLWRVIVRGNRQIKCQDSEGNEVPKNTQDYTEEDFLIMEEDEQALGYITQGLTPEISQCFREITDAKTLWNALIDMYEGNTEMKESRKEMLNNKFNTFNYIVGESLDDQIQRFVTLITEMKSNKIENTNGVINKKLLNSLPRNWDMNVGLIKSTKNLDNLNLTEMVSVIKSHEMNDQQRAQNHILFRKLT